MKDKYWIAFSAIEQIDSAFVQRLYNYFGDVEEAYNAGLNDLEQIDGLSVRKAETFLRERDKINPDKALEEVQNRDIKFLAFEDEKYPKMLKQISNPPAVLYYKGDIEACNFERTLAVVGSRRASYSAKEAVNKILSELKDTDICIVSGLAAGIDTAAHLAALEII